MSETDIYDLKLHERFNFYKQHEKEMEIIRVPGGWIYNITSLIGDINSVFVPYSDEFLSKTKPITSSGILGAWNNTGKAALDEKGI